MGLLWIWCKKYFWTFSLLSIGIKTVLAVQVRKAMEMGPLRSHLLLLLFEGVYVANSLWLNNQMHFLCSILLNALLWMQIAYHAAGAAAMCNDIMPPRSDNFGKADATPIVGMFIYVRLHVLLQCGTRLALNIKGWWINWLGNMGIP